jgi:RNA polymerase sigma-70 factor (ECF subfamily)
MKTDSELVERARAGDDGACEEIVDRFKDRLIKLATRLLGSYERAVEVTQDVFLKMFQVMDHYPKLGTAEAPLDKMLYKMTVNHALNERKRDLRQLTVDVLLVRDSEVDPEEADALAGANEIRMVVRSALAEIPLRYRIPLQLFALEEWTYEQIAASEQITAGTVKSRINRGRVLLRRGLAWYQKN